MHDPGVAVFLPCRAGSVRVPEKNTRPFADHPDGLVGLKLVNVVLNCVSWLDHYCRATFRQAALNTTSPLSILAMSCGDSPSRLA